jgi:hypothetical protein
MIRDVFFLAIAIAMMANAAAAGEDKVKTIQVNGT